MMASFDLKSPQTFDDVNDLIKEYNYMKELIKKANDGSKVLLGFIYNPDTRESRYESLDYTWGKVFAECLEERCKEIESLIKISMKNE